MPKTEVLSGEQVGSGAYSGLALEVLGYLVRYDKKTTNYLELIKVACILLWYRRQHRLSF